MQPSHGLAPRVKRVLALDVLRGIAILMVMFRHNTILYTQAGTLVPLTHAVRGFTWTGVDLFFVLSGYLIGGLLMQEIQRSRSIDISRFLLRRGWKIWPPYIVFVLVQLAMLGPLSGKPLKASVQAMLPAMVHLQNYFFCPITHLWSLAVEEHFYLLFPMVLWFLLRFAGPAMLPRLLGLILAVVLAGCLAIRCLTLKAPFELYSHRFETHLRIDSLAAGVLLAWLRAFHSQAWSWLVSARWLMAAIAAAALVPVAFINDETNRFGWTFEYTEIYIGYACLLIFAIGCGRPRLKVISSLGRGLAFIGSISYCTYLWHVTVEYELARHLFGRFHIHSAHTYAAWTMVNFSVCIVAGWLATVIIEQPCLRLRERMVPSRQYRSESADRQSNPDNSFAAPPMAVAR
jgi:peptidoglycan/LPS O-acetylase OafA/YrhL